MSRRRASRQSRTDAPGGAAGHERPDNGRRRPPTPEEARAATRPVMWFSLLLLAALLLPMLGLPWPLPLVSGALAVAALGLGIYALVRLRRARVGGAMVPVLAVSLALAVYLVFTSVLQAAMWSAYAQYQECADHALTVQAERGCVSELEDAIADRLLG